MQHIAGLRGGLPSGWHVVHDPKRGWAAIRFWWQGSPPQLWAEDVKGHICYGYGALSIGRWTSRSAAYRDLQAARRKTAIRGNQA